MSLKQAIEDIGKLRHMLGVDPRKPRKKWGYRNYYAASKDDIPSMKRLEAEGYVRPNKTSTFIDGDYYYWHATLKGAQMVGITEKAIKELFPSQR